VRVRERVSTRPGGGAALVLIVTYLDLSTKD
jgi:hypothetical protein